MKALLAGATLMLVWMAGSACGGSEASTLQAISIHYSSFEPKALTVPAGQPVTFQIRNDDPIAHEWIIGTEDVHARHRTGTEPYHDQVTTEVTIDAYSTRETTITFHDPGDYLYICHLPGHEAYGMVGTLHVTAP